MPMQPIAQQPAPSVQNKGSQLFPVILVTSLFFLWGFAHNLDPILIPHLKRSFTLTTVQATLVDSAVFAAYFIMAIPAGLIMKKYGYKWGIIIGLLIFAVGSYLFIPAANTQLYSFFLIALFIIACGLTILETAANPYMTTLGDPKTSSLRLNFAQSFNGLAAAVAPVIGARIILTKGHSDTELNAMSTSAKQLALAAEASSVKTPYFILGSVLILIALLFSFVKLPKAQQDGPKIPFSNFFKVLKHPHLAWGAVAQFFYVGAQVCVFSLFILYAAKSAAITQIQAADYLFFCGIAFLAGRFVGTALNVIIQPQKLLALYAVVNVALCLIAIFGHGMITVYTVITICFFMSIMFPTIFSLGIKDLGAETEFGSSLIVMSIVGGAIVPRIFGMVSDATGNIQYGYVVPLVCFAVIAAFGLSGYKVKSREMINLVPDPGNLG